MRILVSGSHGLIGSHLVAVLESEGHEVVRLVRREPHGSQEIEWDPAEGVKNSRALEGLDAVIHLAGEGIADHRWTRAVKKRIRDSRVEGTRLLCEALAGLSKQPKVYVSASAIGYYGDRGVKQLDESSSPGSGFLPEVCREWEGAALDHLEGTGIRKVFLRFGIVLSSEGGALTKMMPAFKLGVAGHIGSGHQYMSWISLEDVIGIIRFALENEELSGPINAVSPEPVTNQVFTKTLGRVLHRPTIIPLPAIAAHIALGDMADELLLASTRVKPARLLSAGYQYQYPELEGALKHIVSH